MSNIKDEIKSISDYIKSLESTKKKYQTNLENIQKNIKKREDDIKKLENSKKGKSDKEKSEIDKKIKKLENTKKTLISSKKEIEELIKGNDEDIQDQKKEKDRLTKESKTELEKLEREFNKATSKYINAKKTFDPINAQNTKNETTIKNLEKNIKKDKDAISKLDSTFAKLLNDESVAITELNSFMVKYNKATDIEKKKLEDQKKKLEDNLNSISKKINNSKYVSMANRIRENQEKLKKAKTADEKYKKDIYNNAKTVFDSIELSYNKTKSNLETSKLNEKIKNKEVVDNRVTLSKDNLKRLKDMVVDDIMNGPFINFTKNEKGNPKFKNRDELYNSVKSLKQKTVVITTVSKGYDRKAYNLPYHPANESGIAKSRFTPMTNKAYRALFELSCNGTKYYFILVNKEVKVDNISNLTSQFGWVFLKEPGEKNSIGRLEDLKESISKGRVSSNDLNSNSKTNKLPQKKKSASKWDGTYTKFDDNDRVVIKNNVIDFLKPHKSNTGYAHFLRSKGIILKDDINRKVTYTHFNRWQFNEIYTSVGTCREYLFFTKPDLYIRRIPLGRKITLTKDLIAEPMYLDLVENYPEIIGQLQFSSNADPNQIPFMPLLSNMTIGNLDLPTINSNEIETSMNIYGTTVKYNGLSLQSSDNFDFSLEFKDTRDLEVYRLFKIWDDYVNKKHIGLITQFSDSRYRINKILHDQISIYKIIVGDDGESIIHYSCLYGCYPKSVPREVFSNLEGGNIKLQVDWHAQWVDDLNPLIIRDFNTITYPAWKDRIKYKKDGASGLVPVYDSKKHEINGGFRNCPVIIEYINTTYDGPKKVIPKLKWV